MQLSKDKKTLLTVDKEDINSEGSFTFPESVTAIASSAFEYLTNLKIINIPSRITSIGGWAFRGCSNLETAILSNNIDKIEDGTFIDCTSLGNIDIPKHVEAIGHGAFYNCAFKFIIIPEKVTTIGQSVLEGCKNLQAVFISKNMTSVGYCALFDCPSLRAIITDGNDSDIRKHENLFSGDYKIRAKIKIKPNSIVPEDNIQLTQIADQISQALHTKSPSCFFNSSQVNNASDTVQAITLDKRRDNMNFS